ncbi:MAG TPA: hypothetical protein VFO03_10925 [Gaiellaceae bacterium]|nr:hypothetical protein [Gaiellaceae bacterium]
MSAAEPVRGREGSSETIAGFLAGLAIFGGVIAVAVRPVTIGLTSLGVALLAAAMASGRHRSLAAASVAIAGAGWLTGMIVCVLTNRPLW